MPDFIYPQKFTFIDLEIPNLNNDRICAVSMIVVEDHQEVLRHTELIDPQTFFSPQNVSIHGIRRADVRGSRTVAQFWEEFKPYFTEDYIIVAHNAMSDISVLNKDLARLGTSIQNRYYLDTMDLCQHHLRNTELQKGDLRLDGIARRFGIPLDHHNPESDVNACYEVVRYLGWFHDFDIQPFIKKLRPRQKPRRQPRKPSGARLSSQLRTVRHMIRRHDPRFNVSLEEAIRKADRALAQNDYEAAMAWYETAASLKSLNPGVYLRLAEIYGEYGMYQEALYIISLGIGRIRKAQGNYYSLLRMEKKLRRARKLRSVRHESNSHPAVQPESEQTGKTGAEPESHAPGLIKEQEGA